MNVYIDEEKRIFNNEIHYFDHPLFGIVVSISKI
ncbi:peptidoglycan binding protein CsiV [Gammaproteobacteria bacterium]|nr:peptidoglycan binding protein CsiV [Gammaproteobacteria bacterium]